MSYVSKTAYLGAFGAGNCADDFLITAFAEERRPDLLIGVAPLVAFDGTPFFPIERAAEELSDHNVVVCGGNFVWSVEQMRNLLRIAQNVRAQGNAFDIRSVHVDHATVSRAPDVFIELAQLSTQFTARDISSIKRVACLGVAIEFERDPLAAYFERNLLRPKPDGQFTISFNFHNAGERSWPWYFEFLATLNHLCGPSVNLIYVMQCRHNFHWQSNESAIAEYLYSRFRGAVVVTPLPSDVDELSGHYIASDIFVTNRTHGLLLSHALRITTAAVSGVDKSDAVAFDLNIPLYFLEEDPVQAGVRLFRSLNLVGRGHGGP